MVATVARSEPPTISFDSTGGAATSVVKSEDQHNRLVEGREEELEEDDPPFIIKKEELEDVIPLPSMWSWIQTKVGSRQWLVTTQDGKNFIVKHGYAQTDVCSCTLEVPDMVTHRRQISTRLPEADDESFWPSHSFNTPAARQATFRAKVVDMVLALRRYFGFDDAVQIG
jgi:hypothetical protein